MPVPMTPPGCDLREFPFMPLDVRRLRDSTLTADESPAAFKAAVLLWATSWHEVPAASLPNVDRFLAKAAGYMAGRTVLPEWAEVRAGALHGWVECDDGRLYHPVVAEKAREAWERRRRQKADQTKRDRQARYRDRRRQLVQELRDGGAQVPVHTNLGKLQEMGRRRDDAGTTLGATPLLRGTTPGATLGTTPAATNENGHGTTPGATPSKASPGTTAGRRRDDAGTTRGTTPTNKGDMDIGHRGEIQARASSATISETSPSIAEAEQLLRAAGLVVQPHDQRVVELLRRGVTPYELSTAAAKAAKKLPSDRNWMAYLLQAIAGIRADADAALTTRPAVNGNGAHGGHAQAVEAELRQHVAQHPDDAEAAAYLQQLDAERAATHGGPSP